MSSIILMYFITAHILVISLTLLPSVLCTRHHWLYNEKHLEIHIPYHPLCVFFFSFLHLLSSLCFKILSCCFQDRPLNIRGFTASHDVSRLCNVVDVNHWLNCLKVLHDQQPRYRYSSRKIVFLQKLTNLVILCLRESKCMYYYCHYWWLWKM